MTVTRFTEFISSETDYSIDVHANAISSGCSSAGGIYSPYGGNGGDLGAFAWADGIETITSSDSFVDLSGTESVIGRSFVISDDSGALACGTIFSGLSSIFEVHMTEEANQKELLYTYTIEATAEGGAVGTTTGTMDIAKVCLADLISDFETSYVYKLPEFITQIETFPSASSDYITVPPSSSVYLPDGYSCSQIFSYRLSDVYTEESNPDELVMETDGQLSLTNLASLKQNYLIDIDITTTDSVNDVYHVVHEVTVIAECGPDSTTITAPYLMDLDKAPRTLPTLTQEGTFTVSNPTCAVASLAITTGDDYYTREGTFNSDGSSDFIVKMNEEAASIVNTYAFAITAVADGGETATSYGYMEIATPIGSTLVSLTGYPDCDGSCTFYSTYSDFSTVAAAADDQPTGTTECSHSLHFGGLEIKTLELY
jgi:hypothetical protein